MMPSDHIDHIINLIIQDIQVQDAHPSSLLFLDVQYWRYAGAGTPNSVIDNLTGYG